MSTTATIDQRVYRIPNMDCAAEEAEIRHALRDIAGLRGLRFRLGARELHVEALPGSLAEIEASLIGAGLAADTVVEIVSEASTGRERQLATTLGRMRAEVKASGLKGPAIIFVRRPKQAAAVLALIA